MAITLVETITVTAAGGVTTLEFANIPNTGKDLMVLYSIRDRADGSDTGTILLNNSSSSFNYRWLRNSGTGGASAGANFNYLEATLVPNTFTASTFSNYQLYIPNYTSNVNKTFSWESVLPNGGSTWLGVLASMRWANTAAITNLKYSHFVANGLAQHTTASLYIVS